MITAAATAILAPIIAQVLDLIPNNNEKNRAKAIIEKAVLDGLNQSMLEQAKTNQNEAKHKAIFVAGWRPFIGWVCGIAIAWSFLVLPILVVAARMAGVPADTIPEIDTATLYQLVLAMLGMGTLRTYEKTKR